MGQLRIVPPDGADWTIDAKVVPEGVALVIGFELQGKPATLQLIMDRPEARKLSDGILTAAGDGTMRTFPKPPETIDG
jgi:hypothetical protein